jgi:hypothetical protein
MGRRAVILEKLGLEHVEHELDVNEYLARKTAENRAGETIEATSESSVGPAGGVVTLPAESSTPAPSYVASVALPDSPEPRDAGSEETETNSHEGE